MSKVFRLYTGGTDTYMDWNSSPAFPYNSAARSDENMPDPDGAKASREITSIPSPFARIDLIKNAFKKVFSGLTGYSTMKEIQNALNGQTIFHKMVSDSLDVGEIFFNYDRFSSIIEIIPWNPNQMINALNASGDEGQMCYADALQTFLNTDGASYNFNLLQNIYLINYINGPQQLNIIGATSPASIFFSNANKIDYINNIQFGGDFPFDEIYQPLYKRNPEYIKFWFLLKNSIPNFSRLFPEVNEYLDKTYQAIEDQSLKNELLNINDPTDISVKPISIQTGTQVNQVEVLGQLLYQQDSKINKSDFTIESTKQPSSDYLVLPVESGNVYADLHYTTAPWGTSNKAPYVCNVADFESRKLPNDFSQHPYLTISDFLEPSLILVPHILNKKSFLAVNSFADVPDGKTYLLPLKPLFFEFFSVEDLKNNNMISFEPIGIDSIKAILRIPIVGRGKVHHVEYSRIYFTGDASISETQNDGGIIDSTNFKDYEIIVMPNIKFPQGTNPEYRISTVSPFSNRSALTFYKDGKPLPSPTPIVRNKNFNTVPKSQTYILKDQLDCLQVSKDGVSGMLIPTFENNATASSIEFTVDLGTSNTHIEMIQNHRRTNIQPFGFTQTEQLQACAFIPSTMVLEGKTIQTDLIETMQVIERDFLPLEILPHSDYNFPTRTVLSYASHTDWNQVTLPWADSNISIPFGKQPNLQYNKYETDIKWSSSGQSDTFAEAYINNIMFMLRCKTLVSGADPAQTPITWFYPTSMSNRRLATFSQAWQDSYNKYFGGNALDCITESLAPVLYFFNRYATATDMVTIDIGGGTTDIAFANNGSVQFVSSFRFAANTLFEDSFSTVNPQNGIIDFFKSFYQDLQIPELTSLLEEFDGQPANMASTFFTLKDSPIIRAASIDPKNVDFCQLLCNDENFKVSFFIFYTAIIYHIGQIIKAKNLTLPRHIAFSGNGSNIVRALVQTNRMGIKILSDFTKTVLESASEKQYGSGILEILGFEDGESPKRATCRGGFLRDGNAINPEKIVYKSSTNSIATAQDTYDKVDTQYIINVQKAVSSFYDFLFHDLTKKVNLYDSFGISQKSLKIAREHCKDDIGTYIRKGIEARQAEQVGGDEIAETFFFYPIKGSLQTISQIIKDSITIN